MTQAEYDQCQQHALELVDWLFTKTDQSHQQLLILGRAFALSTASSLKEGVNWPKAKKNVLAALGHEMDSAKAYIAKHPLGSAKR
jgi:hypothetical protein